MNKERAQNKRANDETLSQRQIDEERVRASIARDQAIEEYIIKTASSASNDPADPDEWIEDYTLPKY